MKINPHTFGTAYRSVQVHAIIIALLIMCVVLSCKTTQPPIPRTIMGTGSLSADELSRFFIMQVPNADKHKVRRLAHYYVQEAAIEGINSDIAFAQMCLETGFLRFGGLVTEDMHNFCGLGAINEQQRGIAFPDEQTGVRAHIQHLKAYATAMPLQQDCVDPRYKYVQPKGKAPDIYGLSGTWASDPLYGKKLHHLLMRMH